MSLEIQATTVRARNRERPTVMISDLAAAADGSVTLEVRDGPMDGQSLAGRFARIKIGRNPGNDLELHSDRSVSSDHAVLRQDEESGGWVVEDLRSTNGTWIDGRRLNPGEPAAIDGEFMVGHTVLRLVPGVEGGDSFLPDAAALRDQTARLAAGFSTETAEGYGAALAQAAAELKPFLSDRHFFLGLLAMNPALPVLARNQGPIPLRFLTETLRRNEYWSGPQAWINRQLRALAIEVASVFKDELVATPRLLRLLLAAAEGARAAKSPVVRPEDVLQAYFAGPANRPRDLLARDGIEAESLLPLLARPGGRKRPEPTKEQAIVVAPAPAGPPPVTTGDPGLDARAQEVARGLYGVAALYQLAAADDRRGAMRQFLVQEIAQVQGDGRTRLLRQVQRLFPVAIGSVPDFTVVSDRTGKIKKPKVEAPAPPPPGDSPGAPCWRARGATRPWPASVRRSAPPPTCSPTSTPSPPPSNGSSSASCRTCARRGSARRPCNSPALAPRSCATPASCSPASRRAPRRSRSTWRRWRPGWWPRWPPTTRGRTSGSRTSGAGRAPPPSSRRWPRRTRRSD